MLNMTTEYKGYTITWCDYNRSFTISQEENELKTRVQTLDDCEKWIDTKLKQKYKRIPVIVREKWGRKNIEGEATSAIDDDYVWVVAMNGERSKVRASDTWLFTPANMEALKNIAKKETEITKLKEEIEKICSSAERLTINMMVTP